MRTISGWWGALGGVLLGACGPKLVPDGSFEVTVTGTATDCTTDATGYRETFVYDLFFTEHVVDIYVEDTPFATGGITGCTINYETPTYLEERDGGTTLQWSLAGKAKYETSPGLCNEDHGWVGTETITVVDSGDETVPMGCTYDMDVIGEYVEP